MNKQTETVEKLSSIFGCDPAELKGDTFRNLFCAVERDYPEVTVYWGCWSKEELDTVV